MTLVLTGLQQRALVAQVEALARDVGLLRRRFASNEHAWTGEYITERLAATVETLHLFAAPTAAELAAAAYPGDDGAADAALVLVDRRALTLRRLLGDRAA